MSLRAIKRQAARLAAQRGDQPPPTRLYLAARIGVTAAGLMGLIFGLRSLMHGTEPARNIYLQPIVPGSYLFILGGVFTALGLVGWSRTGWSRSTDGKAARRK